MHVKKITDFSHPDQFIELLDPDADLYIFYGSGSRGVKIIELTGSGSTTLQVSVLSIFPVRVHISPTNSAECLETHKWSIKLAFLVSHQI